MKLIERELEKLLEKVKEHTSDVAGKSHEDVCMEFIQKQYEIVSGTVGKRFPFNWEHTHNNVIMTYKMYYDRLTPDASFPKAEPATEIVVPHEKPKANEGSVVGHIRPTLPSFNTNGLAASPKAPPPAAASTPGRAKNDGSSLSITETQEERLLILQEVKEHMDLLEKFEGIVHRDILKKRKRDLFDALPSVPPSAMARLQTRRQGERLV